MKQLQKAKALVCGSALKYDDYLQNKRLTFFDYCKVASIYATYIFMIIFILHFFYIFKTYYDDPGRIRMYEIAHSSFDRCLTETDHEFQIKCAERKRWATRWYWVNILDDVMMEHVDHLRQSPEFPSLFGSWGHMQMMKITESLVSLIQILVGSIWYLIPVGTMIILLNIYMFCRFPVHYGEDLWTRFQQQREEDQRKLNLRAQQAFGGSQGSVFLPVEKAREQQQYRRQQQQQHLLEAPVELEHDFFIPKQFDYVNR